MFYTKADEVNNILEIELNKLVVRATIRATCGKRSIRLWKELPRGKGILGKKEGSRLPRPGPVTYEREGDDFGRIDLPMFRQ